MAFMKITIETGAWLDRLLEAVETIGRMANGGLSDTVVHRETVPGDMLAETQTTDGDPDTIAGSREFVSSFNGLVCTLCNEPQYTSPGGITCANGCVGAAGTAPEKNDVTTTNDPSTEQVPPPPAGAGVELADGIPHDVRIHASTRTKLKTKPFGWKLKRGVDPAIIESVTAELRAAMAIPAAGQQQPPATDAETAFGTEQQPPAPPAAPVMIATWAELVLAITPALAAGTLTQATIDAELALVGLQSIQLLGARPDLIPLVAAKLFPGV